jgi:hypothetical protein
LALVTLAVAAGCGARPLLPAGSDGTRAAPADGSYQDGFIPGQSGNWVFEQDELGSTGIVNEQLVITVATPNTIQYSALGDQTFGDFALEVDTWQRSGPAESSYGVLFRMQDAGQFYRFEITSNGLYMVERRNSDGTWTRLVRDWTPSTAINQGLNVANRLKIIAAGPNLTFYANDILLTQVTDSGYSGGAIALDAGTFGGGNLQVSFDNLSITSGVP